MSTLLDPMQLERCQFKALNREMGQHTVIKPTATRYVKSHLSAAQFQTSLCPITLRARVFGSCCCHPLTCVLFGASSTITQTDDSPIFSLGRVQFALPSTLLSLSCTSNILLLCVAGLPRPSPQSTSGGQSPQLIRIDLDRPTEVDTIELAIPPPVQSREGGIISSVHKVHADPTGRHVIVSTTSGDNFYVYVGTLPVSNSSNHHHQATRRAKPLTKLKGAVIEAVAWAPSSSSSTSSTSFSTREILLGTATGQILETTLLDPTLAESSSFSLPVPGRSGAPERYLKHLYTLRERQAVTGLRCETWGKRAAVIVTTQTRIYQFVGNLGGQRRDEEGSMLEGMFQQYASGDLQPSALRLSAWGVRGFVLTRRWPCRIAGAARRADQLGVAPLCTITNRLEGFHHGSHTSKECRLAHRYASPSLLTSPFPN